MKPSDCPKFAACSAPVCPLDCQWSLRAHNREDRVCIYACEAMKAGADARLEAKVLTACRRIAADDRLPARIRRQLQRAANSGSRLVAGGLLRRIPGGAAVGMASKAASDASAVA
ncbi:MAG TPA: hypothetical protein VGP72_31930 [Planctomycetota bacterium]|jgi:hypothetical protein